MLIACGIIGRDEEDLFSARGSSALGRRGELRVIQHVRDAARERLVNHTRDLDNPSAVEIKDPDRSVPVAPGAPAVIEEQVILEGLHGLLGYPAEDTVDAALKISQLPEVSLEVFDLLRGTCSSSFDHKTSLLIAERSHCFTSTGFQLCVSSK
jgi:hypothetical protein